MYSFYKDSRYRISCLVIKQNVKKLFKLLREKTLVSSIPFHVILDLVLRPTSSGHVVFIIFTIP
jgi:hypothetical protein